MFYTSGFMGVLMRVLCSVKRCLIFGAILWGTLTSCTQHPKTIEEQLHHDAGRIAAYYAEKAAREQDQGRFDRAAEFYRKALESVPYDPTLHNNYGTCLYHLGKVDSAVAEFKEAIRLQPNYAAAYVNLGNAYRLQGKYDLAIAALREAIRRDPTLARAHATLGLTYDRMGKLDLARKAYETAVRVDPSDLVARFNLGSAYLRLGYLNQAIAQLTRIVDIDPENTRARYLLAVGYMGKCQFEDAEAQLVEAVKQNPTETEYLNHLGLTQVLLGRCSDAVGTFREAVEIQPHTPEYRYNLGMALTECDSLPLAEREFQRCLSDRPGWGRALVRLGEVLQRLRKFEGAKRAYISALAGDSASVTIWHHLGRLYLDVGKADSAVLALSKAVSLLEEGRSPSFASAFGSERASVVEDFAYCTARGKAKRLSAEVYLDYGRALLKAGNERVADGAIRRALDEDPSLYEAYELLATAHEEHGRKTEAVRERALAYAARGLLALEADSLTAAERWFRKALALVPGLSECYTNLGKILCVRGKVDSAVTLLDQALSIDPSDAPAYVYLGDCYVKRQQYDRAAAAYVKAIELDPTRREAFRGLGRAYLELGSADQSARMYAHIHFLNARDFLNDGQIDRAVDELRKALELNPHHYAANLTLGQIYGARDLTEQAIDYLQEAVGIDSTRAEGRYALGMILFKAGRTAEAVRELNAAIRLDPTMGRAYYGLARVYLQVGDVAKAERYYQNAQQVGFPIPADFVERLRRARRER